MVDIIESTRVDLSYHESVSDELRGRRFIDVFPSCPMCKAAQFNVDRSTVKGRFYRWTARCQSCHAVWSINELEHVRDYTVSLIDPGENPHGIELHRLDDPQPMTFWYSVSENLLCTKCQAQVHRRVVPFHTYGIFGKWRWFSNIFMSPTQYQSMSRITQVLPVEMRVCPTCRHIDLLAPVDKDSITDAIKEGFQRE